MKNRKSKTHRVPLRATRKHKKLLQFWSDTETALLEKKLSENIVAPIFICGLARSGTSIVTHILNNHEDTGSFLYRDLPFVETPHLWSKFNSLFYGKQNPRQREHGDAISVSPDSPDAFEELIWKEYLEDYKSDGFCRFLDPSYSNQALEKPLPLSIKKVLYTRGKKSRYLSKGNYNLFRLPYLLKLFPDAKVILCLRQPFQHASSLARVHRKFMEIAEHDPKFSQHLELLGHYEFGPGRKALKVEAGNHHKTLKHWDKEEHYEGYLLQWLDVYSMVSKHYRNNPNIYWLDHDQFLEQPENTLRQILSFTDLPEGKIDLSKQLERIQSHPKKEVPSTSYDSQALDLYETMY